MAAPPRNTASPHTRHAGFKEYGSGPTLFVYGIRTGLFRIHGGEGDIHEKYLYFANIHLRSPGVGTAAILTFPVESRTDLLAVPGVKGNIRNR